MSAAALTPSQRVVEAGDTVRLQFVGPGTVSTTDAEYRIQDAELKNRHSWGSKLLGRKHGDSVTLPEAEGNEVTAVILSIV